MEVQIKYILSSAPNRLRRYDGYCRNIKIYLRVNNDNIELNQSTFNEVIIKLKDYLEQRNDDNLLNRHSQIDKFLGLRRNSFHNYIEVDFRGISVRANSYSYIQAVKKIFRDLRAFSPIDRALCAR